MIIYDFIFRNTIEKKLKNGVQKVIEKNGSKLTMETYPFKHVIIENALPEETLNEIENDFHRIPLDSKHNDLFKFRQV